MWLYLKFKFLPISAPLSIPSASICVSVRVCTIEFALAIEFVPLCLHQGPFIIRYVLIRFATTSVCNDPVAGPVVQCSTRLHSIQGQLQRTNGNEQRTSLALAQLFATHRNLCVLCSSVYGLICSLPHTRTYFSQCCVVQ